MSPGPRPTSVPSCILIHPAVSPQQTLCPFGGGDLTSNTLYGRGLPPYQVASWSIRPFATADMDRKFEGGCAAFEWKLGPQNSPSNTVWPRPSSLPSGFLIHPAVCHSRHGPKIWGGAVPLLSGSWVPKTPHLTQYGRAEAYLHAEFHIDPSNRLATIPGIFLHPPQGG